MSQRIIAILEQLVQAELQPDLTLYLDVPVAVAKSRIADREHDRFESERVEFFERVRATYLKRSKTLDRYRVIDASASLIEVQATITRIFNDYTDGVA